jgi:hypothetical protein
MKFTFLLLVTYLIHSQICFAESDPMQSFVKKLCPSISNLSSSVMEARQKNISSDEVKKMIQLGIESNSDVKSKIIQQQLINSLEMLVNETQYFPILKNESDKKLLINSYTIFVLNRCHDSLKYLPEIKE